MHKPVVAVTYAVVTILFALDLHGQQVTGRPSRGGIAISTQMHHLRIAGRREWEEFPEHPDAASLEVPFVATKNQTKWTLQLRQHDVKQAWNITLNDQRIGQLIRDENEMVFYHTVPAGTIVDGMNVLRIGQGDRGRAVADDVRVGEVTVLEASREKILYESIVEVEVSDGDSGTPLPARLTIVQRGGVLQSTGAVTFGHMAVRPGTIYTSTGAARFGLPAGSYTLYAGRGFEYSLDTIELHLLPAETKKVCMTIRREVPTDGHVACDTHVHSLTHS
jgi:hypothetical protein